MALAPSLGELLWLPSPQVLDVYPKGDGTPLDQTFVVVRPVADPISDFLAASLALTGSGFESLAFIFHASSLAVPAIRATTPF